MARKHLGHIDYAVVCCPSLRSAQSGASRARFILAVPLPYYRENSYILTSSRLEKSRSQRVLWLLEELKVDYELKIYKRKDMLAPAELKEVHPLGKSPIVTVETEGTPKPLVLAESGFIFEYLIDHFGAWLSPKRYCAGKDGQAGGETEEWMRYKYYMHYAEGSLMPVLVMFLVFNGKSKL